jgi:hypothetical protein
MKKERRKYWLAWPVLLLVLSSMTWAGTGSTNSETEKAIVAKLAKNSVLVLANGQGKLTPGENNLCMVVRDPVTGSAMDVRAVSIDFAQHVGRILESPIRAQLTQKSVGRFCGRVNLGFPYYKPMNFHVDVRYVDAGNRKQKLGFCITAG